MGKDQNGLHIALILRALPEKPFGRAFEGRERLRHHGQIGASRLSEDNSLRATGEEISPKTPLERLDLLADSGGGHVELARCAGETFGPGRSLENAEPVERGQTGHG